MSKTVLTAPRKLQIEIIKELNETALYLFQYYVSVISNPVIDLLDDKRVAKTIGWTARKVRDTRLKLTKANYIYFHRVIIDSVTYNTWVITKEEVEIFKNNNNSINKPKVVISTENRKAITVDDVEYTRAVESTYDNDCNHFYNVNPDTQESQCVKCGKFQ